MVVAEKIEYFSFSKVKMFKECPKKFELRYIEGKEPLPSSIMNEGKERHKEIQQAIIEGRYEDVPEKLRYILEKYFINEIQMEKEFSVDIYGNEIKGYMDIVSIDIDSRTGNIIDLKLFKEPDSEQLKLYAMALFEENPELVVVRGWYYMLGLDYYVSYTFFREDIEGYKDELDEFIGEMITTEEFKAKPSEKCATCPFVHICSEAAKYEIDTIQTEEDLQKVVDTIYLYEGYAKKYKELLKDYLLINGINEVKTENAKAYLSPAVSLRMGSPNGRSRKKK